MLAVNQKPSKQPQTTNHKQQTAASCLIFVKTSFIMEMTTILTGLSVVLIGALFYLFYGKKTDAAQTPKNTGSNALQLQAYERLTLLVDRIALPNLISRSLHDGLSARDMQLVLTKTIRDEFDYNITQQIYINPEVWNAVKSLKEKNLLVINQIASTLPPNAGGLDLNRSILEYLMNDNKSNLHELVSEALSYEAKKLL